MAGQRRGWRYFATRLNGDGTETMLDPDLPLEGVSIDDVLSGDGSINATISPAYPRLIGPDRKPIMREWSTAIYAENNGAIRAGAILTKSTLAGPQVSLEAVGFTGYGRDMPYTGSGWYGVQVDPLDIVRLIWDHIQTQPGGDIGLELGFTSTPVKIGTTLKQVSFDTQEGPASFEAGPYKLNWYSNHDLQGDVDDLASSTPFDYHERHYWDAAGNLRHALDFGYPAIGRRRTDLRFVFGVNIFETPTVDRDGSLYASGTMVVGKGDGGPSTIYVVSEPPTRPEGRLRRIAVVEDNTISSKTRARQRADAENQWRRSLDDITSITVHDHPNARLGAAQVGDEIYVEGRGDWTDVGLWARITAISYQPDSGNVAEYSIARTDKLTS